MTTNIESKEAVAQSKNLKAEKSESNWCALLYISGMYPIFPFSNIIFPLLIWMFKKEGSESITMHGKNVLNFQITLTIIAISLLIPVMFVPYMFYLTTSGIFAMLVAMLYPAIIVTNLVLSIIAGIKAYNKEFLKLPKYNFIK